MQAVRPHSGVDGPVTQAAPVVAAPEEPAVVEHEPFHTQPRGGVGEGAQPVEVVVEVDRLPGVEDDRPGSSRVLWPRAHVTVQAVGEPVQAGVGPAGDQPRRGVGLPRAKYHLTWREQLAAAEQTLAGWQPLRPGGVVATPRDVRAPHLAVAEPETRRACHHQQGRVVAGAAVPRVAYPGALVQQPALRRPLPAPASGQVQHLGRRAGQRQTGQQGVDDIRPLATIDQLVPDPHHSLRAELDGAGQPHLELVVAAVQVAGGRRGVECDVAAGRTQQRRRRRRRAGRVAGQPGAAGPAAGRLRHQTDPHRTVQ